MRGEVTEEWLLSAWVANENTLFSHGERHSRLRWLVRDPFTAWHAESRLCGPGLSESRQSCSTAWPRPVRNG